MANIQMEYRVYSCELDQEKFCEQCLTDAASDLGCISSRSAIVLYLVLAYTPI